MPQEKTFQEKLTETIEWAHTKTELLNARSTKELHETGGPVPFFRPLEVLLAQCCLHLQEIRDIIKKDATITKGK